MGWLVGWLVNTLSDWLIDQGKALKKMLEEGGVVGVEDYQVEEEMEAKKEEFTAALEQGSSYAISAQFQLFKNLN